MRRSTFSPFPRFGLPGGKWCKPFEKVIHFLSVCSYNNRGVPTAPAPSRRHLLPAQTKTGSLCRNDGSLNSEGGRSLCCAVPDNYFLEKCPRILSRIAHIDNHLIAWSKRFFVPPDLRTMTRSIDIENGQRLRGPIGGDNLHVAAFTQRYFPQIEEHRFELQRPGTLDATIFCVGTPGPNTRPVGLCNSSSARGASHRQNQTNQDFTHIPHFVPPRNPDSGSAAAFQR